MKNVFVRSINSTRTRCYQQHKHPGVPGRNRREKRRDSERETAVFGRTASSRRRERGRYHPIERDVPAVGEKEDSAEGKPRVWHVA